MTEEQAQAIKERTGSRAGIPVDTQWRRRLEIEELRRRATTEAVSLKDDPQWIAGVVLYWAEGAKTPNHLKMANSDPAALRLFISWLRRYISTDVEFVLQLHLHEGNDEGLSISYWQQAIGLPNAPFHKTFIKPRGTGHRKNHLEHGVCTVHVRAASNYWHVTMAWVDFLRSELATG